MKIVALAASVGEEDSARVMSSGCDDFLRKPIKAEDMFNVLRQQINVRFITEQPAGLNDAVRPELSKDDLLSALATVPDDLVRSLHENVELGDISRLSDIIQSIANLHQPLADALESIVDRFDFDELIAYLKEVQAE